MNENEFHKNLTPPEQHTTGTREETGLPSAPGPSTQSRSRTRLFIIVAGILFISFLSVELIVHGTSGERRTPSSKRTVAIQVEVLNGTKASGFAERVRDRLRSGGFDVVDIGNYKSSDVEKTLVIARTPDRDAAESVASFLGTDRNKVLVQPDKNLYLDVSVVIGRDITQLRSLK